VIQGGDVLVSATMSMKILVFSGEQFSPSTSALTVFYFSSTAADQFRAPSLGHFGSVFSDEIFSRKIFRIQIFRFFASSAGCTMFYLDLDDLTLCVARRVTGRGCYK